MKDAILIVDDVEVVRASLRALFESHYEIYEAENGLDAWEKLNNAPVSAILLDLSMPVMSGIELLHKIRETDIFTELPVIIITSSEETEMLVEAFQAGATDYIVKPFLPKITVFRVTNAIMANRRMKRILDEERKLKRKAELDLLTNLYNKVTAQEKIKALLDEMSPSLSALFIFDIDQFKEINDENGHTTGDHVLKVVADILSSRFRCGDIVGRIGGDEFIAFMMNIPTRDAATEKAEEIIGIMKQDPCPTPVRISVSIGIAFHEKVSDGFQELFDKADRAMYRVKQTNKGNYSIFQDDTIDIL